MPVVSLSVPGRLEYRELAIRTVALVCKVAAQEGDLRDARQRDDLANELVSAVGEAFNNVVLHGYRGREDGEIGIVTDFDGTRIIVEVVDFGSSFDPDSIASPDLGSLPVSGMGLYIIRSFADRFEYLPGHPNILRLTKLLRREGP